nr:hypothetical protein [Tanacetum cinerariifolium]
MVNTNPPLEVPPSFLIEKVLKLDSILESLNLKPQSSHSGVVSRLAPRKNPKNLIGLNNFMGRAKGIHIFVWNFTCVSDFMIVKDLSLVIDPRKENMKSVYLRNVEDKKKGVEYVMSKILGFYKECMELGPEYRTDQEESSSGASENHGGVT